MSFSRLPPCRGGGASEEGSSESATKGRRCATLPPLTVIRIGRGSGLGCSEERGAEGRRLGAGPLGRASAGVGHAPESDSLAATVELGVCPNSMIDEILAMLVELPATVPDFDRDLAETAELGVCPSSLRRDLGDARRVAGDGAGLRPRLGGDGGAWRVSELLETRSWRCSSSCRRRCRTLIATWWAR